jgi:hypothetical protein
MNRLSNILLCFRAGFVVRVRNLGFKCLVYVNEFLVVRHLTPVFAQLPRVEAKFAPAGPIPLPNNTILALILLYCALFRERVRA